VTVAGYRLVDLAERISSRWSAVVRPFLADIVAADWADQWSALDSGEEWTLCVNGRLAPRPAAIDVLNRLARGKSAAHFLATLPPGGPDPDGPGSGEGRGNDAVVAALVPTSKLVGRELLPQDFGRALVEDSAVVPAEPNLQLIDGVHDYVRLNTGLFAENLNDRLRRETWHEVADGVFSANTEFGLPSHAAFDTSGGPVLLSAGCQIQPFVFFQGPVFLGSDNRIASHSAIRECVSTGQGCRLGGEIEATVVESWSNKQHHGFLGHAHVGSWVNLGAGTSNSDLKNTYGNVSMQQGDRRVDTGMQFVGCFIGDYAKTAINASIYTGKRIGACSMLYGTAMEDVPPFVNYARLFGQVTVVDPLVMVRTQTRMFARRGVEQRTCDIRLIEKIFARTEPARAGVPAGPPVWQHSSRVDGEAGRPTPYRPEQEFSS
jgi:glucose-1-phosphate thymidylyltransferase